MVLDTPTGYTSSVPHGGIEHWSHIGRSLVAETYITTYAVTGMSCGHCAAAVTEELSRIDGVTSVGVDLETGSVAVTSDAPLSVDDVRAAVDDAGYELTP